MPPKKQPPLKVGQPVWVLATVVRVAEEKTAAARTLVTVELPSGHRDTSPYNPDKMKPDA